MYSFTSVDNQLLHNTIIITKQWLLTSTII